MFEEFVVSDCSAGGRGMLQWVGSLLFRVDGGRTDCFGVRSPMDGGMDTIHLKIYALKVSE